MAKNIPVPNTRTLNATKTIGTQSIILNFAGFYGPGRDLGKRSWCHDLPGGSAEVANLALLNQLKAEKGAATGQQIYEQMRWLEDPRALPPARTRAGQRMVLISPCERLGPGPLEDVRWHPHPLQRPQQGFNNPAFVTAIGLHGAGYDLTGMTPIGLLPVLFGTDGTIAWAVADLNARYFVPSSNRPPPRFLCQTWHERQRMHSSLGTCV